MIAIIPARGGSKGLPGKNVKNLNGKPLIAYTIEAALKAECIDRVVVTTDNKKIAEISVKYGAEVPFLRPKHLARDDSKAVDTYLYMIDELQELENITINELMVLLPTCPLRTSVDICNAYNLFKEKEADSVISYTQEKHPIFWHKYIDGEGKFEDIFEDSIANRQQLRTTFYPNGAIYIFKTKLLKKKEYYSKKSYAYIMPGRRSVDIDTSDDFEYVEFLMCNSGKKEK